MRCTFLDFKRDKRIVACVSRKPHCAKVTPTELLDDHVPVSHYFTNMNGVVSTYFVVGDALVLTLVGVGEKFFNWQFVFESLFSIRRFRVIVLLRILFLPLLALFLLVAILLLLN